jgi:hypothetical protein
MNEHDSTVVRAGGGAEPTRIWFDRRELDLILRVYGKMVAQGEWRDYAIGAFADHAAFQVFRRASEAPSWSIEKHPQLARRQGAYALVSAAGQVVRRGHDLAQVLRWFDRRRFDVVR